MNTEEVKSIQVMIGGRSYPLKIQVKDEKGILKVVEEVNAKIRQFQSRYTQLDKLDFLSMSLLTYAVEFYKIRESQEDPELLGKFDHLDALLDEALA
jgi:cell division protein ZapA (FtsZ GTPase activity inhibitor)